jgi:hypothetical protein
LAPAVTVLFNRILSSGVVPSVYKRGTICPIPKPGTDEFRPISLLPHLSKVLERVVLHHWLKPHISTKLRSDQFAFTSKEGQGTTNALTTITHAILLTTDSPGGIARVLAIDFVKAFDRAATQHILSTLVQLGVPRECYTWICSFMSDRLQRVRLEGAYSDWEHVRSGVPQGSVLGPFLFAVLIDTLVPLHPHRTFCIKYADDVTLIHQVPKGEIDQTDEEWLHVCQWAHLHDLEVNTKKTKTMTVSFSKSRPSLDTLCGENGSCVEEVTSMKLLGLHFSNDMKWTMQVMGCTKRAFRNLFLLRQMKHGGAPSNVLWSIHYALNRSLLAYAAPTTTNMSDELVKKLEKVEKRAARIIGCEPPLALREFIRRICSRLMRRILMCPSHPLSSLFVVNVSHRNTRKRSTLLSPFSRTSRFKNSFIKFASLV